jgi:hypothetical protein
MMTMPLAVNGCFYAKLPELQKIETQPYRQCVKSTAQCPPMPPPFPRDARLVVVGGKVVEADKGGESIVRGYVGARKNIGACLR